MRAGHEPVAGSLAPTPTVSDAPTATYRTAAVGEGEGVLVARTVAVGEAGVGDGAAVAEGLAHAASATEKRNRRAFRIVRIDGA